MEKERQELERWREKERLRQLEIERQKETERQRLAEEKSRQDEERRMREEQRITQKAIEKHNMSVQKASAGITSFTGASAAQQSSGCSMKTLQISLPNIGLSAPVKPYMPPTAAVAPSAKPKAVPERPVPVMNQTFQRNHHLIRTT
jgi:predicted PP-loop superfamily ATPase